MVKVEGLEGFGLLDDIFMSGHIIGVRGQLIREQMQFVKERREKKQALMNSRISFLKNSRISFLKDNLKGFLSRTLLRSMRLHERLQGYTTGIVSR